MPFPSTRLRRLRTHSLLRKVVQETDLPARRLMVPLFVREGTRQRVPIASMPGQYQLSIDTLVAEAKTFLRKGIQSILLFGIPRKKDPQGTGAYSPQGIIQ